MSAGFPAASGLFPTFSNNPPSAVAASGQSVFSPNPYFVSSSYPQQANLVNSSFLSDRPRIKLKRTRQRVDAGEPRNTYNSIPSYTPGRSAPPPPLPVPPGPFGGQMSAAPGFVIPSTFNQRKTPSSSSPDTSAGAAAADPQQQQQQQNYFRAAYENVYGSSFSNYWANPYVQTFLRMQQHQQQRQQNHPNELLVATNNNSSSNNRPSDQSTECDDKIKTDSNKDEEREKSEQEVSAENGRDHSRDDTAKDVEEELEEEEDESEEVCPKKARVENIINTIQPSPSACSDHSPKAREEAECPSPEENGPLFSSDGIPKSKRKQYQPQQLDSIPDDEEALLEREMTDFEEGNDEAEDDFDADDSLGEEEPSEKLISSDDRRTVKETEGNMKTEIKRMQSEIFVMQQRYMEMFAAQQKRYMYGMSGTAAPPLPPPPPPLPQPPQPATTVATAIANGQHEHKENPPAAVRNESSDNKNGGQASSGKDLKSLAQNLKTELISCMNTTVDKIISQYLQAEAERLAALATAQQNAAALEGRTTGGGTAPGFGDQRQQQQQQQQIGRPPFYFPPFYYNPSAALAPFGSNFNFSMPNTSMANGQSIFPQYANGNPYLNNLNVGGGLTPKASDDSNLPFGLARKKRSKVTDTRVSKLPLRQDDSTAANSPATFGYPTMVPHQMFQNHSYGSLDDSDIGGASPDNSDGTGSEMAPYDPNMPQSTTLTPMHLRKAKLMFFYTRYPSSALLKAFFPDIRFNKNNTAQLVKWFSNFREFYYIQMEKYARQALAEGVRSSDEIQVGLDSELYKVLNLHYNRNNHIQVPPNFRRVIEATLREFFLAIQASRDVEPSWKKAIYKVIARMDEPIPEYFKTPNFLEQLE